MVKVCFVGIGSIAKRHIRNLHQICNELRIDLTVDALRRKNSDVSDKLEYISNTYYTSDELPKDYDVIFLTNPTEYHVQSLIQLHNNEKHFFIEKPVASLDTIGLLENFKMRSDSVYYVACPLRYTDVIQYLKSNIDDKKVNSIRVISSSYLPDWRPGIDYRKTYSAHKNLGGGVSIDLIHEWDYLSFLFGLPDEVKSFIGKVSNLEIDSDDFAVYIAKYSDNMIAELHLDYFGRKTIRKIEIYTDKDTIVGDLIAGEVRYLKSGEIVKLQSDRDIYQKRELRHFIGLINGKIDEYNDVGNAIKVLKLTQGL